MLHSYFRSSSSGKRMVIYLAFKITVASTSLLLSRRSIDRHSLAVSLAGVVASNNIGSISLLLTLTLTEPTKSFTRVTISERGKAGLIFMNWLNSWASMSSPYYVSLYLLMRWIISDCASGLETAKRCLLILRTTSAILWSVSLLRCSTTLNS